MVLSMRACPFVTRRLDLENSWRDGAFFDLAEEFWRHAGILVTLHHASWLSWTFTRCQHYCSLDTASACAEIWLHLKCAVKAKSCAWACEHPVHECPRGSIPFALHGDEVEGRFLQMVLPP